MEPLAISAVAIAIGWLLARRRDKASGQPRRWAVRAGTWLVMGATVFGIVRWPEPTGDRLADATALLGWLTLGWGATYFASHRATGWTSVGEVITTAVSLVWRRPLAALAGLTALALAGWVYASLPVERVAVLAVAVALTPAVAMGVSALDREHTTTLIEHALAGAMSGGTDWETPRADLHGAPVSVKFDRQNAPVVVTAPMPPELPERRIEYLQADVKARLGRWGGRLWLVHPDLSARVVTATLGPGLPSRLEWDGTPCASLG